jgi:hypothetical protein
MDFEVIKRYIFSGKTTKKTIKPNSVLIFFLFIITISFSANDSGSWVLRKNKNGIAIYTRYEDGFSIKELRLVDTVQSSLSGIVGLLLDTKNYTSWVYHCSESKTLKLINDQEEYDYELISVPWPFNDRDLISDSKISQDSSTKTVTINTVAAPGYIPDVDGVVRIKQFNSVYILTKLAGGKIKIDYTVYADPGGNIPVWLINANIVSGPYNTFFSMNERLSQYQSASFSFIKE